ncbi:hypothetical protein GDO86_012599 [Hymenochirus boettgeri]|uniref:IGFBP N-terminal domain-containing protein n=1 Tax=Hymenochirus boettgeri TaxID=247094 RepID=A0A8T2IV03_9PIPI|nr:hypothetical protein GDO86_012599 [Hymenochirus boettgeri]
MRFKCILLTFLFFMIQSSRANICSPCNETTCPPILFGCGSYRAIDPCGCCEHCARGNMEPCGGKNWEIGYCNRDLQCMAITGKGLVQIPMIGICKEIQGPGKEYFQDADENCPVQNVCYKHHQKEKMSYLKNFVFMEVVTSLKKNVFVSQNSVTTRGSFSSVTSQSVTKHVLNNIVPM